MSVRGIDVSHWQGDINWTKVAKDGVKFAFIKATEGTSYSKVGYFKENVPKALKAGIDVGAYHYAKFGTVAEAKKEAAYFLNIVGEVELTYPLVLDLEENKKGASKKTLTDAAIEFLEALENAGYFAMLYTGKSFLENTLDENRLKPYALWIARYNSELGRTADIWQYTSSGRIQGISGDVDMNIAYRDFGYQRKTKNTEKKTSKPSTKQSAKSTSKYHTVKSGDTVSELAVKYGTTTSKIKSLNKLKDANLIYIGQKLRVK